MQVAVFLCVAGLLICGLIHYDISYILGIFVMGLGYGVIQPLIYDKTSFLASTSAKSTAYFSYLLTCNYVGISCVPFIVGGMKKLFHAGGDHNFSFLFNAGVCVVVLVIAIIGRKSYVFEADPTFANSTAKNPDSSSSTEEAGK